MPALEFSGAMRAAGLIPYPEQLTIADYLDQALLSKSMALIEAPTGAGKTYDIAWNGLEAALTKPAVIAVPSIELVFSTHAAVITLKAASKTYEKIRVNAVLGRPEYVSPSTLAEHFEEHEALSAIEGWIEAGGPGAENHHPRWTRHGLRKALRDAGHTDDLPDEVGLKAGDKESVAAIAYQAQFDRDGDLLIVTHAMLAIDLRARFSAASRWVRDNAASPFGLSYRERLNHEHELRLDADIEDAGRLPDFKHLILDEAHGAADNIRNVLTHGISLTTLISALREAQAHKIITAAALEEFTTIRAGISRHISSNDEYSSIFVDWRKPSGPIPGLVGKLSDLLGSIPSRKLTKLSDEDRIAIERASRNLHLAKAAPAGINTVVTWSPVHNYPTIHVGKPNIRAELSYLWDMLDSSALVSATIYTLDHGGTGANHIITQLALPKSVIANAPIKGEWLYKPVTLKLPSALQVKSLAYPTGRTTRKSREQWCAALADVIAETIPSGDHRCLVLTTSLEATAHIAKFLSRSLAGTEIIAGHKTNLSAAKERFLAAKHRVIWIAQGPAWTGLDLPDHMLNSLYITKLPMPTPNLTQDKSRTHDFLSNRAKMHIQLKQGIGRLVRSRCSPPKTLWCLDAAHNDKKFMAAAIFSNYAAEFF